MAMKIGIDTCSNKRIESAIKYALNISSNNGHTCVLKENLIKFIEELLHIDKKYIEDSIVNLRAKKQIILEKREDIEWVYLYQT